MPFRFKLSKGIVTIEQKFIKPAIYFDTWTYNQILINKLIAEDIAKLITEDYGTLCISDANIMEIIKRNSRDVSKIVDYIYNTYFVFTEDNPLSINVFKDLSIYHEYNFHIDHPSELKKAMFSLDSRQMEKGLYQIKSMIDGIRSSPDDKLKMIKAYKKNIGKSNPSPREIIKDYRQYMIS
jgi:hypothetical protein